MTKQLEVADKLSFPSSVVTQTIGVLAVRGAGKTKDNAVRGRATTRAEKLAKQRAYTRKWREKNREKLTHAEKLEKLKRQRAYMKKWREKNREKYREYFRNYYAANREAIRARWHRDEDKWYARLREKSKTPEAKIKRKLYREGNREKIRARTRAYRQRNAERVKEWARQSRERHREKKRLKDRLYRQQKPDICKAGIARARAKKPELYKQIAIKRTSARRSRKLKNPVEPVSLERIEVRDRSLCHLCRLPVERNKRSFDHLIPVVRGGAHAEWNLMVAHLRCNQSRGTKKVLHDETKEEALAYIEARVIGQERAA